MKRIITLSIAAVVLTGSAMAQNTKKAGQKEQAKEWKKNGNHGKKDRGEFVKDLNLSDAQKEQFKSLNKDYRAKEQVLRDERKAKAEQILTAEQKQKIEAQKQERKAAAEAKAENRFENMQKELNLSNDQAAKLKASNEAFRNKRKAILDDTSLSQEQKREQMKALADQHKTAVEGILTAEQIEKMKSQRINNKGAKRNS